MALIAKAFSKQINSFRRNPSTSVAILITLLLVVYLGSKHGKIIQSIAYLLAIWTCMFLIDIFTEWKNTDNNDLPVRQPGKESLYVLICVLLGVPFLFIRLANPEYWDSMQGTVKLGIASLLIFVYPIALSLIMLLLKYKLKDIGFKFSGALVSIPTIIIIALTTYLIAPENSGWNSMYKSLGLPGLLFTALIASGLSEEFWRLIAQTRFGAFLKNKSWGWFLATFIWAFMHAPNWYGKNKDLFEALIGSVRIIPIGLMWGYLTHRTKSLIPAAIVHGTNLWGLQNF